jgi:hypothetical protein
MTNDRTNNLHVINGGGALPADHPLKWLLRPNLVLVWDADEMPTRRGAPAFPENGQAGHG